MRELIAGSPLAAVEGVLWGQVAGSLPTLRAEQWADAVVAERRSLVSAAEPLPAAVDRLTRERWVWWAGVGDDVEAQLAVWPSATVGEVTMAVVPWCVADRLSLSVPMWWAPGDVAVSDPVPSVEQLRLAASLADDQLLSPSEMWDVLVASVLVLAAPDPVPVWVPELLPADVAADVLRCRWELEQTSPAAAR
jgi:hypothetical protein